MEEDKVENVKKVNQKDKDGNTALFLGKKTKIMEASGFYFQPYKK